MKVCPVNFGYSGYFLTREEAATDAVKHNSVTVGFIYAPESGEGSKFNGQPIYCVKTDEEPNKTRASDPVRSRLGDLSYALKHRSETLFKGLLTLENGFSYDNVMDTFVKSEAMA